MVKVALLGASGGVGQPLSLLLKMSPMIDVLALYGRRMIDGIMTDLSHIPMGPRVVGYTPLNDGLEHALTDCDIVLVCVGLSLVPNFVSRNDLLTANAPIVGELIEACARYCPAACICMISNPMNSLVPLAAAILKAHKVFDPRKLLGVMTLDTNRAEVFLAETCGYRDPTPVLIPIVGGHSAETMAPLFSQTVPLMAISEEQIDELIMRVQHGGREVFFAKGKEGTATLSTAWAAARLVAKVCRAMKGASDQMESVYVSLGRIKGGIEIATRVGVAFFSVPVVFGPEGVKEVLNPFKKINASERELVASCAESLQVDIQAGIDIFRKDFRDRETPDVSG